MDNERIQRLHKFMHDFKMFLRDNYYDIENKDIQWYLRGLVQFNVNESSELIMENYEKLYKEALKRAKEINNEQHAQPFDVMTKVFPELKESEDEKIRKALLAYFDEQCDMSDWNGVYGYQVVAWLEKQGEQKPADKVEPKFKNGQWIVWQDKCYKVNYNGCGYEMVDQNGLSTSLEYGTVEESAHFWTIQDAKDGDVLACENGWTCIFNCLNDNLFSSHCFMDNEGWFCEDGGQGHTLDKRICGEIHPATKEQCDLLFQKMKEAGYEWDCDKKELKKIEQPKLTEFEEAVKDMMDDYSDAIGENNATTEEVKKHSEYLLSLIPQKTVEWSEEDEQMLNHIICDIESIKEEVVYCKTVCDEEIDWLKSLKERMKGE